MWLARGLAAAVALGSLAVVAGCHANKESTDKESTDKESTELPAAALSSAFEAEVVPVELETANCLGVLAEGPEAAAVVASKEGIQILRRRGAGWQSTVQRFPSEVTRALGPNTGYFSIACVISDLDGDGVSDLGLASTSGGVVVYGFAGASPAVVQMPALPARTAKSVAIQLLDLDLDGDGVLDLFLGIEGPLGARLGEGGAPICRESAPGKPVCRDLGTGADDANVVLLGRPGRRFELVGSPLEDAGLEQAVATIDLDDDGRQELLLCNHLSDNRLFSLPELASLDERFPSLRSPRRSCMGIAHGDLDGDGREDLALSMIGAPEVLFARAGAFEPAGEAHGVRPVRAWSYGIEMEDLDNDGDLDLLVANQLLSPDDWQAVCPNCGINDLDQPEVMLGANDGSGRLGFTSPALFPRPLRGHTPLVVQDLDADGVQDALLLRGEAEGDAEVWFLKGRLSRPYGSVAVDAPRGAVVEACVGERCSRRQVIGGGSFHVSRPARVRFGLGAAPSATVRVQWPHGTWRSLGEVPSGSVVRAP